MSSSNSATTHSGNVMGNRADVLRFDICGRKKEKIAHALLFFQNNLG